MHFEYPWVFTLLILFWICEKRCPLRLDLLYFPHVAMVAKSARADRTTALFKWVAVIGLLGALASPVTEDRYKNNLAPARDMVLLVDTSRSMEEAGFDPAQQRMSRFMVLQKVLKKFIAQREGDRLALAVFGRYAFVSSPLTFDVKLLSQMTRFLHVGMAGDQTAIFDALALGVNLLETSEAKSRIMVLMTDGRNTAGEVPAPVAMKMIQKHAVKLYTIGIGYGSDYDKPLLEYLAKESGGEFFEAANRDMLEQVMQTIEALETTDIRRDELVLKRYFFVYPLFLASLALLGYIYLRNRSLA